MFRSALVVSLCLSAAPAFAQSAEDMVKMQERQAAAVAANAPDCDKMAKALLATADEDTAVLKKLIAADASKTKEQKKAEQAEMIAKFGPRLKEAKTKLEPLKACRENANFKAWRAKFEAATAPPKN